MEDSDGDDAPLGDQPRRQSLIHLVVQADTPLFDQRPDQRGGEDLGSVRKPHGMQRGHLLQGTSEIVSETGSDNFPKKAFNAIF